MPPVRTCVITRESADPDDLVRIIAGPDGVAHVDWHGRWKGRGAWLRCQRAVFEEASRKPGILQRALGTAPLDTSGLWPEAKTANETAILDLLALTARAGAAVSGADALERTNPESLLALLGAADAADSSIAAVAARFPSIPLVRMALDREALGHRIGKGPRAIVGIRPSAPARSLLRELRRMQALG